MIQPPDSRRISRLSIFSLTWLAVVISSVLVDAQQTSDVLPAERGFSGREPAVVDAAEIQSVMNDQPASDEIMTSAPSGIDLLTLIMRGGVFMIPIGVMSLMVVRIGV